MSQIIATLLVTTSYVKGGGYEKPKDLPEGRINPGSQGDGARYRKVQDNK